MTRNLVHLVATYGRYEPTSKNLLGDCLLVVIMLRATFAVTKIVFKAGRPKSDQPKTQPVQLPATAMCLPGYVVMVEGSN